MAASIPTTTTLATFAAQTGFDALPADVVHHSKRLLCDTLGCMLGGCTHEIGLLATRVAQSLGGVPESTLLGRGLKTSCANAAFVNGTAANALDMDESFLNFAHPAAMVVAAALAIGERRHVSGRDLLAATAVGYDVACRIGVSTESHGLLKKNAVSSVSWQTFGAVVAAGRLLGLAPEVMADAFGIGGVLAPMPSQAHYEVQPERLSLIKYYPAGWSAQAGVTAALLAEAGFTGPNTILDGETGFWRMQGCSSCDFDYLVSELGSRWWVREVAFKPWPTCRATHAYLTAFESVIDEHRLRPEEIDAVVVRGHFNPQGNPPQRKFALTQPRDPVNMQFSVPFGLANVAFRIPPGPQYHARERVEDPAMRAFREKVSLEFDPATAAVMREQLSGDPPRRVKRLAARVEVRARGQIFSGSSEYAKGDPWSPATVLSDADLARKFRNNASALAPGSTSWERRVDQIIERIFDLEAVADVGELTALMAP